MASNICSGVTDSPRAGGPRRSAIPNNPSTTSKGDGDKKNSHMHFVTLMVPTFSGYWYAAAAGASAYVGNKAKEEGYTTKSPVTKQTQHKQEEKAEN